MTKFVLIFAIFISVEFLYAMDFEAAENAVDPALLPKTFFNSKKCKANLPIRKGTNPWLRIVKKKAPSMGGMSSGDHFIDSYYFLAANRKGLAVVNTQDSIYDSATSIEKIDCKHGLLYFRKTMGEGVVTNHYRVYDLYSGEEYPTIEGAVTMSPNGKYLLVMSATDRDQKCGGTENCEVKMKIYECPGREKKNAACHLKTEEIYNVVSTLGKRANFNAMQAKWNWLKVQNQLTLKIGGSPKSPAKINCTLLPSYSCKGHGAKGVQIYKKEST